MNIISEAYVSIGLVSNITEASVRSQSAGTQFLKKVEYSYTGWNRGVILAWSTGALSHPEFNAQCESQ